MSQSKLSSAPQGPSSTERAVSPPDAVKSTVSPVTSRTGKRLPDEEFTSHDQEATVPVDAALTAEAQRDDEATAPVDAASATGEAPSTQESSALAVETAAASPTNSNLSKLGLGALALVGLAAAVAGGGGDSKGAPQSPSQPSEEDGKPQVPSQPSGSDSKPPPVQVPGVGTKPINGQGVVTVSGVVDGAEWEFSLDDGDTWHKGDGNGVSASDLVEGPNTITIVQTDKDGNRSDAVVVVVIKDSIIEKPVLGTSTGTGAINDTGSISVGGIENNGKWEFSVD
ncbi:hypothetical protein ACTJKJ_14810, partial [Roseateles sp. 22389]|uniref:hypothetical protein n=1 Tax=Roseateles sp. 22389 TaxID=3453916 RepID=UPI003F876F74